MTERRPHWDDDLLYSVKRCMNAPAPLTDDDRAYNIIAAVEDWMDANDNPLPHVLNECLQWLDADRAAIQRVRELHRICTSLSAVDGGCGLTEHTEDDPEVCWECCVEWPCPTIRALGGPCPTCRGPIRETVGLVCQTCGTDYGRPDGTA